MPIAATASTGTWRVKAFTDPKRPAVGEATFMVEDYVPDRLEFDLAAPAGKIAPDAPAEVTLNGRFLYGAPAANLDLEGEILVSAAKERPGFPGYQFGNTSEAVNTERQPLERSAVRPTMTAKPTFDGRTRQSADHRAFARRPRSMSVSPSPADARSSAS